MPKEWFTDRVTKEVEVSFSYLTDTVTKRLPIKDEADAGYMWLMSERGYQFKDIEHG